MTTRTPSPCMSSAMMFTTTPTVTTTRTSGNRKIGMGTKLMANTPCSCQTDARRQSLTKWPETPDSSPTLSMKERSSTTPTCPSHRLMLRSNRRTDHRKLTSHQQISTQHNWCITTCQLLHHLSLHIFMPSLLINHHQPMVKQSQHTTFLQPTHLQS